MTDMKFLPHQLRAIGELLGESKFVNANSHIEILIDNGGVKITHTTVFENGDVDSCM